MFYKPLLIMFCLYVCLLGGIVSCLVYNDDINYKLLESIKKEISYRGVPKSLDQQFQNLKKQFPDMDSQHIFNKLSAVGIQERSLFDSDMLNNELGNNKVEVKKEGMQHGRSPHANMKLYSTHIGDLEVIMKKFDKNNIKPTLSQVEQAIESGPLPDILQSSTSELLGPMKNSFISTKELKMTNTQSSPDIKSTILSGSSINEMKKLNSAIKPPTGIVSRDFIRCVAQCRYRRKTKLSTFARFKKKIIHPKNPFAKLSVPQVVVGPSMTIIAMIGVPLIIMKMVDPDKEQNPVTTIETPMYLDNEYIGTSKQMDVNGVLIGASFVIVSICIIIKVVKSR